MMGPIVNTREDIFAAIDAQFVTEQAKVRVRRVDRETFAADLATPDPCFRFDLSLTPRPEHLEVTYPKLWHPHHRVQLGDFFVVPPGQELTLLPGSGGDCADFVHTAVVCHIAPGLVEQWFVGKLDWNTCQLMRCFNIMDVSLHALMKMIARETVTPVFSSKVMMDGLVRQVAIEAGRHFAAIEEEPVKGGLAAWRLRIIDERIRRAGSSPTLDELATQCKISVRQLSRGFRASRGCSIGDYIEHVRFENAKRLILEGRDLKEVATHLGYASQSSFSQAFRRATGVTPTHYQLRA